MVRLVVPAHRQGTISFDVSGGVVAGKAVLCSAARTNFFPIEPRYRNVCSGGPATRGWEPEGVAIPRSPGRDEPEHLNFKELDAIIVRVP